MEQEEPKSGQRSDGSIAVHIADVERLTDAYLHVMTEQVKAGDHPWVVVSAAMYAIGRTLALMDMPLDPDKPVRRMLLPIVRGYESMFEPDSGPVQ